MGTVQPGALPSLPAAWQAPTLPPVEQAFTVSQAEFDSAETLFERGVNYHRAGQLEDAILSYEEAIRADPTFDSAYINLGLAFIQANQLDNAIPMFQQILSLPERTEEPASNYTLAHYNLAIIYSRQGDAEAALEEVQQALEITPNFERGQELLQQLQEPQQEQ